MANTLLMVLSILLTMQEIHTMDPDDNDIFANVIGDDATNRLYRGRLLRNQRGNYNWINGPIPDSLWNALCIINKPGRPEGSEQDGGYVNNWLKQQAAGEYKPDVEIKVEPQAANRKGDVLCCKFPFDKRFCYSASMSDNERKQYRLQAVDELSDNEYTLGSNKSKDVDTVEQRFVDYSHERDQSRSGDEGNNDWTQSPMNGATFATQLCNALSGINNSQGTSESIKAKMKIGPHGSSEKTMEALQCTLEEENNLESKTIARYFVPYKDPEELVLYWFEFHKEILSVRRKASVEIKKMDSKFYTLKSDTPLYSTGLPRYHPLEKDESLCSSRKKDGVPKSNTNLKKPQPEELFDEETDIKYYNDFDTVTSTQKIDEVKKKFVEFFKNSTNKSISWRNNPIPRFVLKGICSDAIGYGFDYKPVVKAVVITQGHIIGRFYIADMLYCKFSDDDVIPMQLVQTSYHHFNAVQLEGPVHNLKSDHDTYLYNINRAFSKKYGGLRPIEEYKFTWRNQHVFSYLLTWMCAESKGYSTPGVLIANEIYSGISLNLQPNGFFQTTDVVTCKLRFPVMTEEDNNEEDIDSSSYIKLHSSEVIGDYIHETFTGVINPFYKGDGLLLEAKKFERGFYYTLPDWKILRMERRQRQFEFSEEIFALKTEALRQYQEEFERLENDGKLPKGMRLFKEWTPSIFLDWITIFDYNTQPQLEEMCRNHDSDTNFVKYHRITLRLEPVAKDIKTYALVCQYNEKSPNSGALLHAIISTIAYVDLFEVTRVLEEIDPNLNGSQGVTDDEEKIRKGKFVPGDQKEINQLITDHSNGVYPMYEFHWDN